MTKQNHLAPALAFVTFTLCGCGLTLPGLQGLAENSDTEKFDENIIVNQIKCELENGIKETLDDPFFKTPTALTGNSVDWLNTWAAQVTLNLTVEDSSALAPGMSLNEPFNAPSKATRSIAIGVQGSADATHKESLNFTYALADLYKISKKVNQCSDNGILIHSDLQIADFIKNKAFVARVPGSLPAAGYSGFTYDATFKVMFSGNVTPSWKFVRLSVNPSGTLFSATRTQTQEVILTLGPAKSGTPATGPTQPTQLADPAQALHDAALIGQAVATAIQNLGVIP